MLGCSIERKFKAAGLSLGPLGHCTGVPFQTIIPGERGVQYVSACYPGGRGV